MGANPALEEPSQAGRRPSVLLAGESNTPRVYEPSNGANYDPTGTSRASIVANMSRRLFEESREMAALHSAEVREASQILSRHPQLVQSARADQRLKARARSLAQKNKVRPSNSFVNHPHPTWRDAGYTNSVFGFPRPQRRRPTWVPAVHNEGEDSPQAKLKRALADNFTRVIALFRKWDVNCDGRVSIQELNDAIGALRLHEGSASWGPQACAELFAALDTDGSGFIDFHELHHALRKYEPPPFEVATQSAQPAPEFGKVPARRTPRPRHVDAEAVVGVKRLLAMNQSRVLDLFRQWDYDEESSISEVELRRALAALSTPIDARALALLFRQIDTDGSGAISFRELNDVLRRHVDRDTGGGEMFDGVTGTYTTRQTHVKQKATSLPAIRTTASVKYMEPQVVRAVPADALRAAEYAAGRGERDLRDHRQRAAHEHGARTSRAAHGVS